MRTHLAVAVLLAGCLTGPRADAGWSSRAKLRGEIDACQRTTGDLQGARLQLERPVENARKLGVPPGWVR